MAARSAPAQPTPANLTPARMLAAIPQLERRKRGLETFNLSQIQDDDDQEVDALRILYNDTLMEIFGHDTIEYHRYSMSSLYQSNEPLTMSPDFMGGRRGPDVAAIRDAYRTGIQQALRHIETIMRRFRERVADAGETPAARAARAFGELNIHPTIAAASERLFVGGHHANAVLDACLALNRMVQQKSNRPDLDGTDLMGHVFSLGRPILRVVDDLTTDTGRSEQLGAMSMAVGAIQWLRNPRAHEIRGDDPTRAIEYIAFLSMLAKIVDAART